MPLEIWRLQQRLRNRRCCRNNELSLRRPQPDDSTNIARWNDHWPPVRLCGKSSLHHSAGINRPVVSSCYVSIRPLESFNDGDRSAPGDGELQPETIYTYDNVGNIKTKTLQALSGAFITEETEYDYDKMNRVTEQKQFPARHY